MLRPSRGLRRPWPADQLVRPRWPDQLPPSVPEYHPSLGLWLGKIVDVLAPAPLLPLASYDLPIALHRGCRRSEEGASTAVAQPPPPSRYESQKRRDWNTFLQYLKNHKSSLTLAHCSDTHVIEFLKYLNLFWKTKVHVTGYPYFGHPNRPPYARRCPSGWPLLVQVVGQKQCLSGHFTSSFRSHLFEGLSALPSRHHMAYKYKDLNYEHEKSKRITIKQLLENSNFYRKLKKTLSLGGGGEDNLIATKQTESQEVAIKRVYCTLNKLTGESLIRILTRSTSDFCTIDIEENH
ncbi:hypothetical protein ACSBR2_016843 [Camellia fascicularis]